MEIIKARETEDGWVEIEVQKEKNNSDQPQDLSINIKSICNILYGI